MRRTPVLIVAGLGAACAIAAVLWKLREPSASSVAPAPDEGQGGASAALPVRPKVEPGPVSARPARPPEPRPPQLTPQWRAELTEKVAGLARPGEAAFTAYADRFVDDNLALAEEQARAEGLSVPEVRALTRMGLMVMTTQRMQEVEEILGRDLPPEKEEALGKLVQEVNGDFKTRMRGLVKNGAPESERWELISAADARYREGFFQTSGMTPDQFDDLLAGDLLLPGSPPAGAAGEATDPGKRDTIAVPPRPGADPLGNR